MPIQLRHQTQQSVSPSALSHGVGLPVSDGGAGAVSRALGQVAGAASQIGATLKRKEDAASQLAATLKRKDEIVQNNSAKLAGERIQQGMDDDFEKVQSVLASKDYAASQTALEEFNKKYNNIDVNTHINTDDGEVPLREDRVKLIGEQYKTAASGYHRQLYTKSLNLQTKAVQMAQVTESAEMARTAVTDSVDEYIPTSTLEAGHLRMVEGYNHESVSGHQDAIQGDYADQAEEFFGAFSRSIRHHKNPADLLGDEGEIRNYQRLLASDEMQQTIGDKAGTIIGRLDKLYSDLNKSPDISGMLSQVDSRMAEVLTKQELPTATGISSIGTQAASINDTLTTYGNALPEADRKKLISSSAILGSRAEFGIGQNGVRATAYEYISDNPEMSSQALVGALSEELGIKVEDVSVADQIEYGNYLKGFHKKVAAVEELYGKDTYETRRWLGGQQAAQVGAEGDDMLSKVIDSAIEAKNTGEPISLNPRALAEVRSAYGAGRGDYVGLSVLHDLYTNPETRGHFGIAAQTIAAVWGDSGVNTFISKNSAEDAPTMNRELALIHSMAGMSPTDTVAQVAEQVQMVNEDQILKELPAQHQKDAYSAVLKYRSGLSSGSVDKYGNKIKSMFGSELDQLSEGVYDIGAQIVQAFTVEGDTVGATMWSRRINAMFAQEIRNHTDGPIDPRNIYNTVMDKLSSEVTVAHAPNGSTIIVPMKSMTHNWVKEGVSPDDAGLVMMHSAVGTAKRLGVDIAKELRGMYAIKSTDNEAEAAMKQDMGEYESDDEFLHKVMSQQVLAVVNGRETYVSALRLGMAGMDANGNSVRSLLYYNPNTGAVQNVMKKDGAPIMISERGLQMGVGSVQAKKIKNEQRKALFNKFYAPIAGGRKLPNVESDIEQFGKKVFDTLGRGVREESEEEYGDVPLPDITSGLKRGAGALRSTTRSLQGYSK